METWYDDKSLSSSEDVVLTKADFNEQAFVMSLSCLKKSELKCRLDVLWSQHRSLESRIKRKRSLVKIEEPRKKLKVHNTTFDDDNEAEPGGKTPVSSNNCRQKGDSWTYAPPAIAGSSKMDSKLHKLASSEGKSEGITEVEKGEVQKEDLTRVQLLIQILEKIRSRKLYHGLPAKPSSFYLKCRWCKKRGKRPEAEAKVLPAGFLKAEEKLKQMERCSICAHLFHQECCGGENEKEISSTSKWYCSGCDLIIKLLEPSKGTNPDWLAPLNENLNPNALNNEQLESRFMRSREKLYENQARLVSETLIYLKEIEKNVENALTAKSVETQVQDLREKHSQEIETKDDLIAKTMEKRKDTRKKCKAMQEEIETKKKLYNKKGQITVLSKAKKTLTKVRKKKSKTEALRKKMSAKFEKERGKQSAEQQRVQDENAKCITKVAEDTKEMKQKVSVLKNEVLQLKEKIKLLKGKGVISEINTEASKKELEYRHTEIEKQLQDKKLEQAPKELTKLVSKHRASQIEVKLMSLKTKDVLAGAKTIASDKELKNAHTKIENEQLTKAVSKHKALQLKGKLNSVKAKDVIPGAKTVASDEELKPRTKIEDEQRDIKPKQIHEKDTKANIKRLDDLKRSSTCDKTEIQTLRKARENSVVSVKGKPNSKVCSDIGKRKEMRKRDVRDSKIQKRHPQKKILTVPVPRPLVEMSTRRLSFKSKAYGESRSLQNLPRLPRSKAIRSRIPKHPSKASTTTRSSPRTDMDRLARKSIFVTKPAPRSTLLTRAGKKLPASTKTRLRYRSETRNSRGLPTSSTNPPIGSLLKRKLHLVSSRTPRTVSSYKRKRTTALNISVDIDLHSPSLDLSNISNSSSIAPSTPEQKVKKPTTLPHTPSNLRPKANSPIRPLPEQISFGEKTRNRPFTSLYYALRALKSCPLTRKPKLSLYHADEKSRLDPIINWYMKMASLLAPEQKKQLDVPVWKQHWAFLN